MGLVIQMDETLTRGEAYQVLEEMRKRIDDLYGDKAKPVLSMVPGLLGAAAEQAETPAKLVGEALRAASV